MGNKKKFGDYDSALDMRDIIKRMVADELQRQRPRYRYGIVSSVSLATLKANVVYTGETLPVTVNTGSNAFVMPGDVVRIEGVGSDKFIADVIGRDPINESLDYTDSEVAAALASANSHTDAIVRTESHLESDLPSAYSYGITLCDGGGGSNYFPTSPYSYVVTEKINTSRMSQRLIRKGDGANVLEWVRYAYGDSLWSPWQPAVWKSVDFTPVTTSTTSGIIPTGSNTGYLRGSTGKVQVNLYFTRTAGTETGQIFVLPEGFRPDRIAYGIGGGAGDARCTIQALSTGSVQIAANAASYTSLVVGTLSFTASPIA